MTNPCSGMYLYGNTISICGNIGCGKSTLIKKLKAIPIRDEPIAIFEEPIGSWKEWLRCFYTNPAKYALGFQMKILLSFRSMIESIQSPTLITERSPFESVNIFSRMMLENGTLSQMDFDLIQETFEQIGWQTDLYIYIRTDPNICIERIKQRGRDCENDIDEQYVYDLHNQYEKIMGNEKNINVVYVDGNVDPEQVEQFVRTRITEYVKEMKQKF